MPDHETTKDVLRRLRKSRGMTQEALQQASADRVTASFIGLIETGRRLPSQETIEILGQAMDLTENERVDLINAKVADRMERPGFEVAHSRPYDGDEDPTLAALNADQSLSDEDRSTVIALVKRLRGR